VGKTVKFKIAWQNTAGRPGKAFPATPNVAYPQSVPAMNIPHPAGKAVNSGIADTSVFVINNDCFIHSYTSFLLYNTQRDSKVKSILSMEMKK
jgi:hypothetical protein